MESNGITGREMLRGVGSVGAGALLGSGLTTLARAPWYELGIIGEPIRTSTCSE